jgi:hypothetical protein
MTYSRTDVLLALILIALVIALIWGWGLAS